MLGNYAELKLDRSKYPGGKILDLGFGDGRNMSLLNNCGLDIYGVEIAQDILDMVHSSINDLGFSATLKVGTNTNIPFEDNFFDYILASSSCYYVDGGSSFTDNLKEITRVLKPGGFIIANFPGFTDIKEIPDNFIFDRAIRQDDGHIIVQNDLYGLRNGYKLKTFSSKQDVMNAFSPAYEDIGVGYLFDHYYGVEINMYIMAARKK
jgi:ubiquinone/menaquinone biosynthesis C-methylase UbiE